MATPAIGRPVRSAFFGTAWCVLSDPVLPRKSRVVPGCYLYTFGLMHRASCGVANPRPKGKVQMVHLDLMAAYRERHA